MQKVPALRGGAVGAVTMVVAPSGLIAGQEQIGCREPDISRGAALDEANALLATDADAECDLDVIPNQGRAAEVGAALCNCLGFGSKNSALVLGRAGH